MLAGRARPSYKGEREERLADGRRTEKCGGCEVSCREMKRMAAITPAL
jgi:hypothetical protein